MRRYLWSRLVRIFFVVCVFATFYLILQIPQKKHVIQYPGHLGSPVSVPTHLEYEERRELDEHGYNAVASDLIPENRELPEVRPKFCQHSWRFMPSSSIHQVSVIIPVYQEAKSILLRAIRALLNRTPDSLLLEIILIDDYSDLDHSNSAIREDFFQMSRKIRLHRSFEHLGAAAARSLGVDLSRGSTLVFMDAHTEVAVGWLEPLLVEMYRSGYNRTVVAPQLLHINSEDLSVDGVPEIGAVRAGFCWYFRVRLEEAVHNPNITREQHGNSEDWHPFHSPVLPNGIFAVSRTYWNYLGGLDRSMRDGEVALLDFSLRTWMCGGQILIHPCSRVGHIYRRASTEVSDTAVSSSPHHNFALQTTVSLWRMADRLLTGVYRQLFEAMYPPIAVNVETNDLKIARKLRSLKCLSFQWYLKVVYPEGDFPTSVKFFGKLRPFLAPHLCLDHLHSMAGAIVRLSSCNQGSSASKIVAFTSSGRIQSLDLCLHAFHAGVMRYSKCRQYNSDHSSDVKRGFQFDIQPTNHHNNTFFLVHSYTGLCLTTTEEIGMFSYASVYLKSCYPIKRNHEWLLSK